jgi:hypothetical protein
MFGFLFTGILTDKAPTGEKCFIYFGTFRRDTQFGSRVSILFLSFFQERTLWRPPAITDELLRGLGAGSDPDTAPALCCLR